jgi:hypothetical protein
MDHVEIEMVCVIDQDGDYGVGKDEDSARQDYEDNIGGTPLCLRAVVCKVTVPLPRPIVLTGVVSVQEQDTGASLLCE